MLTPSQATTPLPAVNPYFFLSTVRHSAHRNALGRFTQVVWADSTRGQAYSTVVPSSTEIVLPRILYTGWSKVSVHLMTTIQIDASNVQSSNFHYLTKSDCLAADRQCQGDTRLTLTPSVIHNSNYVIMVSDWNCLTYFCVFLYCNHQAHRDVLITLYFYSCPFYPIPDLLDLPQAAGFVRDRAIVFGQDLYIQGVPKKYIHILHYYGSSM
jgi:hypothetical protein